MWLVRFDHSSGNIAGISDSTTSGLSQKADVRNRSVRVRNLPIGTQEGLLQQALEKIATVKRVEVLMEQQEAIVELESAAVSIHSRLHSKDIYRSETGSRKIAITL